MKIDTQAKRLRLAIRREPYWEQISKGKYIGFRRTLGGGSWVARLRDDDNKQKYHALGSDHDYSDALKAAMTWLEYAPRAENHHYTLKNAVDDYVKHLEINNSPRASKDTEKRLDKHLSDTLLKTEISQLTTSRLNRWRDGMVKTGNNDDDTRKSKYTANRVLGMLKAALNLAFKNGIVASDTEWRRVPTFRNVADNRKLFLTDKQVGALLKNTTGGLYRLVKAAILIGARYGELAVVKVKDFDPKGGTIELTGKTGQRTCYLSDNAVAFFKEICTDRLPEANILVKDGGSAWGRAHQQRPIKDAIKKAKLPRDTVFYSLRHYHISKALLSGMPMQVVAENAGTSVLMIEKHYGKFTQKDRRAMMNEVELG